MTVHQALQWGITKLEKAGVSTPALDVEVLLDHVLSSPLPQSSPIKGEEAKEQVPSPLVGEGRVRGHAWMYAHPEMPLRVSTLTQYKRLIARRARREPIAYITGRKEFYGLNFLVNRYVMVPRPETETLLEAAFSEIKNKKSKIKDIVVADVGTGSGAIIVALANQLTKRYHLNARRYFATDISSAALRVARANARRHGVAERIKFLHGNFLEPLLSNWRDRANLTTTSAHIIVTANLPYLPTSEWRATQPEISKWEPRQALDGGRDGLKYYRELFRQLDHFTSSRGRRPWRSREIASSAYGGLAMTVVCELCPHQVRVFKTIVRHYFSAAVFRRAARHVVVVRI